MKNKTILLKQLFHVEVAKLTTRVNALYILASLAIVLLQVFFLVPFDQAGSTAKAANRYIDNFIFTIIPILFIVSLTAEFENHIVHRFLVSGLSRRKYFYAKVIGCLLYAGIALCLVLVCGTVTSLHYRLSFPFAPIVLVKYYFIAFYTCSMSLLISFLSRKTALAIIVFVGATIIDQVIAQALFGGNTSFLPFTSALQLIRAPFDLVYLYALIFYTVLFLFIACKVYSKADLS